ncbi:low-density lipoprotein receptor-related protein 1B [Lates japonicus]|uniref:Low-density lipoprotein receptor-related protein 1B n=1 Tax=Lates japonicus TaxID=270547 RepID=A0AAD3R821_LATJO|nr:low-density lipoprotein receptor-related protein 1B [Lates japonicus]
MSVSGRSSKGTVLENNAQSVTSYRCMTLRSCGVWGVYAVRLSTCMSVCTLNRSTGPIQSCMSGPVLQSGGVHVSGCRGKRCTVLRTGSAGHHRITALDNRVVVEGETGPGPGPGEAPWLLIARSP